MKSWLYACKVTKLLTTHRFLHVENTNFYNSGIRQIAEDFVKRPLLKGRDEPSTDEREFENLSPINPVCI